MANQIDVSLTVEGDLIVILFKTNLAKEVLNKNKTLNKLSYIKNNIPTVEFPKQAKDLIKTFLLQKELNYCET